MHLSDGEFNCRSSKWRELSNDGSVADCEFTRLLVEGSSPDTNLSDFRIRSHLSTAVAFFDGTTMRLTGEGGGSSAVILYALRGSCRAGQDGRVAHIHKGGCTLVCTARPLEISADSPCEIFFVSVSAEAAGSWVTRLPTTALSARLEGDLSRLVCGYLEKFAELAPTLPLHLFAGLCRSAFSMGLIGAADCQQGGHHIGWTRRVALEKAKSFVMPRLTQKLTPRMVASELGISLRQLHAVFAQEGLTFSTWLWQQRLSASKSKLCDARYERESIEAIALASGFTNFSHFSRRFRAAYGVPARDFRRANAQR
jgi:AraC family transcriptional regulator, positive regulator of tynA and feaB